MPFCGSCGKQYDDELNFCPHCGAPNALFKTEKQNPPDHDAAFKTVKRDAGPYGAYRLEDLPEGFVIDDRYEVKAKVGQGGFGAVYRAFDKKMAVDKALKIIPDSVAADEEAMGELHAEARTMVALNNENIVRVYDVHDSGSIKYIDMEYVDGLPLSKVKLDSPDKKLQEKTVKALALRIARGLSYAHRNKVIHKDIKPQNIMVTRDKQVKIMDFGISETVRTSMSRLANSSSSGTLVYMAPEQVKGEDVGPEADIYSFGAMLYELLSGHPPFWKGDIHYQLFNEVPKPIDGVSDDMNALVLKCLEKDYRKRFRSFDEVEATLTGKELPERPAADEAKTVREVPKPASTAKKVPESPAGPQKKSKVPLYLGIGAGVVAAVLAVVFLVLPNLGGNEYVEQILELDPSANTLLVELENITGKVLDAGEVDGTVRGLNNALDDQPGNVVILSALSMLNRGLGRRDDEYENLSTLVENEAKGVSIPSVLAPLKERHAAMDVLRQDLAATQEDKDWDGLERLLDRAGEEELLTEDAITDGRNRVLKGRLEDALVGKEWQEADRLITEGLETELLAETEGKEAAEKLNAGIAAEKESIKSDIDSALAGKDWEKALELLSVGEKQNYLETSYMAEKRAAAEKLKADEEAAAATAAAEREALRRFQETLDKRDMVLVEGGTFRMGSTGGDDDEEPVHSVTVSSFYLSKYEVTQGLWKEVMGNNPSNTNYGIGNSNPVNNVSWYDAVRFCNKLSERDGLDPAYRISGTDVRCDWSKNGYRLPTEAEWEYAARGGNKSRGYTYAGSNSIGDVAWYHTNSRGNTHPVGQKRPNELGLYDMSGNVWEWCWDRYGSYSRGSQTDPRGASSGRGRVFRGGGWGYGASCCRAAFRGINDPTDRDGNLGVRAARPAVQ